MLETHRVLQGIPKKKVVALASTIDLRKGAVDALNELPLTVLSVNWFDNLIAAVINNRTTKKVAIIANHPLSNGDVLNGDLHRTCVTSYDKSWHIAMSNPIHPVIMVGDSLGDLHALLSSDIGIVIGHSSSLLSLSNRVFQLVPLSDYGLFVESSSLPLLYHAPNWDAILSWYHLNNHENEDD
eukprot:CAMPEP_0117424734 /NCGR_PEP_ID=MMETSP0758-20121206/5105_1 /TAXON_ID=63605 /ORGANISM="Percolomonas cosmopolitus, Strain AE-1 (ATCC 50343)" /LENGTH=182 /DNA_ID=CAMNT_0005208713 /DNA_START=359 /DNA_END=907 /DNA_ORIENTATION=+